MEIISNSPKQTESIARKLARGLEAGDLVALIGELGSGKTVFVKGLAQRLGCLRDEVLSPTFVLLRQYQGRVTLNHFDLYRLKDIQQLEQIGYEEFFYGQGITLIEWADRIPAAIPKRHLRIEIKVRDKNSRLLRIIPKGGFVFRYTPRKAKKRKQ